AVIRAKLQAVLALRPNRPTSSGQDLGLTARAAAGDFCTSSVARLAARQRPSHSPLGRRIEPEVTGGSDGFSRSSRGGNRRHRRPWTCGGGRLAGGGRPLPCALSAGAGEGGPSQRGAEPDPRVESGG